MQPPYPFHRHFLLFCNLLSNLFSSCKREIQMYHTPYKPLYQLLVLSITFPCFLCSAPNKAIPSYDNCKQTFECGDPSVIGELKFPFWGVNRASYCGLPGFEIECVNNTPMIKNSTYNLRVIGTDPQDGKITVSIPDFSNTLCPSLVFSRKLGNFSFIQLRSGSLYMDQSNSYRWLTILYGCPPELGCQLSWSSGNSCDTNKSVNVHFVVTDTVNSSITSQCLHVVVLPILQEKVQYLDKKPSSLVSVLDQGFEMKWFAPQDINCVSCIGSQHNSKCKSCMVSGGECGYDWSKDQFICYCPDNTVSLVCPQSKEGSKHKKSFAIGVSVGVVALLLSLLAGGWIVLARRRRSQLVASQKARGIHPSISNGEGGVGGFKGSNGLTSSQGYTTSSTLSQTTPSYTSSVSDVARDKTCYFGVHVFDYTELEHATCNFDDSKELGDGGFGTVYYGVLPDGRQVAVKRLYENSFKRVEQFMNEIRILAELHHKNLVALYGCTSRRSRELLLVYEYISNGTVADHIHGKLADTTFVPWHTRLSIAIETAEALAFLHRNDVIHRDVKTTNILLDNQFHVKVADFGLSRLFPTDMTHVSTAPQGTPGYVDPDYYVCYKLTEKSDVYSFGVVLIELISSKHAVDITRHRHHVNLANMALDWIQSQEIHKLVDTRLGFDKDDSIKAMVNMVGELGFRCLQQDRDMRPTMDEVMASLRAIQLEGLKPQKQEVVDIIVYGDDVGLLTNPTPPLSPELPRSNDVV